MNNLFNSQTVNIIFWTVFIVGAICLISSAIISLVQSIRKTRIFNNFRKEMKIGDNCNYLNVDQSVGGKITNIEDDIVTIEIKITKDKLYPDNYVYKKNSLL